MTVGPAVSHTAASFSSQQVPSMSFASLSSISGLAISSGKLSASIPREVNAALRTGDCLLPSMGDSSDGSWEDNVVHNKGSWRRIFNSLGRDMPAAFSCCNNQPNPTNPPTLYRAHLSTASSLSSVTGVGVMGVVDLPFPGRGEGTDVEAIGTG